MRCFLRFCCRHNSLAGLADIRRLGPGLFGESVKIAAQIRILLCIPIVDGCAFWRFGRLTFETHLVKGAFFLPPGQLDRNRQRGGALGPHRGAGSIGSANTGHLRARRAHQVRQLAGAGSHRSILGALGGGAGAGHVAQHPGVGANRARHLDALRPGDPLQPLQRCGQLGNALHAGLAAVGARLVGHRAGHLISYALTGAHAFLSAELAAADRCADASQASDHLAGHRAANRHQRFDRASHAAQQRIIVRLRGALGGQARGIGAVSLGQRAIRAGRGRDSARCGPAQL